MSKSPSKRFKRCAISFMLFLLITAITMSVFGISFVFSKSGIANAFLQNEKGGYSDSLSEDVNEYASDLLLQNGLEAIDVDTDGANTAFISSKLGVSKKLKSSNTYNEETVKLNDSIKSQIISNVDKTQTSESIDDCAQDIADKTVNYAKSKIEFKYIDTVKNIIDKGQLVCFTIGIICLIISIYEMVYVSRHSKKKTFFALSADAFCSSGLFQILLATVFKVILHNKNLYIFPTYLCDMITDYARRCTDIMYIFGTVVLVVGIITAVKSMFENAKKNKG